MDVRLVMSFIIIIIVTMITIDHNIKWVGIAYAHKHVPYMDIRFVLLKLREQYVMDEYTLLWWQMKSSSKSDISK